MLHTSNYLKPPSCTVSQEIQQPFCQQAFFPRARSSVPAARDFAEKSLTDWRYPERAADVLLCVSELCTNAVLHGVPPGRGFQLRVWLDRYGLLRVEVHDSGPGEPRLRAPDPHLHRDGGLGLGLVHALADAWGYAPRRPGKVVWCEFFGRGALPPARPTSEDTAGPG